MTQTSASFDFSAHAELLRDPDNAAFYLEQILEGGDMELFQEALREVAKAQKGGVSAMARKAKVSRENVYDAFSKTGKPQMETVNKMLTALGLRFSITPLSRQAKSNGV